MKRAHSGRLDEKSDDVTNASVCVSYQSDAFGCRPPAKIAPRSLSESEMIVACGERARSTSAIVSTCNVPKPMPARASTPDGPTTCRLG